MRTIPVLQLGLIDTWQQTPETQAHERTFRFLAETKSINRIPVPDVCPPRIFMEGAWGISSSLKGAKWSENSNFPFF